MIEQFSDQRQCSPVTLLAAEGSNCFLNSPHHKTDTQDCGAGLAEAKLSPFDDTTFLDTKIKTVNEHVNEYELVILL